MSVKILKCAKQYFIVDLNIFQDAKTFYIEGIQKKTTATTFIKQAVTTF